MSSLKRWLGADQVQKSNRRTQPPPAANALPIVGNTHQFVRDTVGTYTDAARRYGDVVSLRVLGLGELILVSNPVYIKQILETDRTLYTQQSPIYDETRDLLGDGLLLSEGELWRRQRQLIQPAFFRDRIATYAGLMTDHAERVASRWQTGVTYDLEDEMRQLTLRIILEAMFGSDIEYDPGDIRTAVDDLEEPGQPLKQPFAYAIPKSVPIPMWRRYHKATDYFETIIQALIQQRQGSADGRDDLLSMLLTARDEEGDQMGDTQLRDEMMTFLFAGHETTALALTYTWCLLAQHPEVEAQLYDELDSVLGGDAPTMADIPYLPVTERIVKESLRLYPPVPMIARSPRTDVILGDYTLSEESTIGLSQWVVHHDEQFYDDPDSFRPMRWSEEFESNLPDYAYFPFGGGPRRCIGEQFAMVEIQLIVATLAQQYEFDCDVDSSLNVSAAITLLPLERIEMTLRER